MLKTTNEQLGRPTVAEFEKMDKTPLCVVLDNIRSLNNVGSFFRTGDAFAIEKLYLCGITATPPSREIHKTALGAEATVRWEYNKSTVEVIEHLKAEGYTVLAVEQVEGAHMADTFRAESGGRYAIVFGNEVEGVSQEAVDACDGAIEIPQVGTKHSLNVSVAGGIIIWNFFSQMTR